MKFSHNPSTRPARVGALLVAGAALGLLGIDPTANADKALIPEMPDVTDVTIDHGQTPTGAFGIPPLYDGYTYQQDATYTDVGTITNNVSDAFVFDPGGLGFNGDGIVSEDSAPGHTQPHYAGRRAELFGRGRDDTVLHSPRSRLFQHVKDA